MLGVCFARRCGRCESTTMKLISLYAELFSGVHGEPPTPICFMLAFTEHEPIRLRISGRGDTLIIEHEPLQPAHEWENGRTLHQNVIMLLSPRLHNLTVDRIEAINRGNDQIGLTLVAPDEPAFHIWVDGDEFFWGNDQSLRWHWSCAVDLPILRGQISITGG